MEGAMRRLLILAALLSVLALPAPTAAAAPNVTVEIDSIRLVTKELVVVDVTFAVTPPKVTKHRHVDLYPGLEVEVEQATGNRQAYAYGYLDLDPALVLAGGRHTVTMTLAADPFLRPFKSGRAVARASVDASYAWWNDRTGNEGYVDQYGSTGWQPLRLSR
jgi:hypothetical protein